MSIFSYQVKDINGKLSKGTIEAFSEEHAVDSFHKKGLTVLSLIEESQSIFSGDISRFIIRPNKKDLVMFTRQISTLIGADVPLVEGLNTMVRQTEKASFKKIIVEVTSDIEGGSSLSQALAKHKLFTPFYISLVKSGEISGKLQDTLLYLADYLESSAELTSKIKGAMAYPAFIIFTIAAVGLIMTTTVLPNLLPILTESGVSDLPLSTKVLIFITDIINKYIYLLVILVVALVVSFRFWIKTPGGRYKLDMLKIKFPRLGVVARNIYLARIAETLSTLIRAGVPILDGLGITSEIVGHAKYKKILLEAQENVKGGGSISEVLDKYNEFPKLVSSMMAIGEKTGKTDFMLKNIHKFYKSEADRDIRNISQLIEPILVLFLGFIVFVMVSSILLPIYNLVGGA